MTSTERANWTIAYRKRTANRFLRVSTWAGTWSQAVGMARLFGAANPDLEVYYTSNRAAEVEGFVAEEDVRNILVYSGRRIRIVETDVELPAEMIARIPAAEVARERWSDGDPIADAEGADPAGPFVPLAEVAARAGFEVREGRSLGGGPKVHLSRDGRHVKTFHKISAARRWLAANGSAEMIAMLGAACSGPEQVRAWWERHNLGALPKLSAEDILAAREADWTEAIEIDELRTLAAERGFELRQVTGRMPFEVYRSSAPHLLAMNFAGAATAREWIGWHELLDA